MLGKWMPIIIIEVIMFFGMPIEHDHHSDISLICAADFPDIIYNVEGIAIKLFAMPSTCQK